MDREISIVRDTSSAARRIAATQISDSIIHLRGDVPDIIHKAINSIDFETSQLTVRPTFSPVFLASQLNDLLDLLFTDLVIQYTDIFSLQQAKKRVETLVSETVVPQVLRSGALAARLRDLEYLSSYQYSYSDLVRDSFDNPANYTDSGNELSVNPRAGILRLSSETTYHCGENNTRLTLRPVSTGLRLLDESDESGAYGSNPLEPYYITLIGNGNPSNSDYSVVSLSSYSGAVVDITATFAGIYALNRVSFAPFSNAPVTVIGIYSSTMPNVGLDDPDIVEVSINDVSYDNAEIEVNFERVYTRELHILVLQPRFMTETTDCVLAVTETPEAYIAYCSSVLKKVGGFREYDNPSAQIDELVGSVTSSLAMPEEIIKSPVRSYVIGLYQFSATNVAYAASGDYLGTTHTLEGNLTTVGYRCDGSESVVNSGIVDAVTLFSVNTGYSSLYYGEDHDGVVYDGHICQQNVEYQNGIPIVVTDNPYRIVTHFIPDDDHSMTLYSNGTAFPVPSGTIFTDHAFETELQLPSSFCDDANLYDGMVLTSSYNISSTDHFGRSYSVYTADVLERVGRPNIGDPLSSTIYSPYLYTTDVDYGTVTQSRSYNPTEYTALVISGVVTYCLYEGKGEEPGERYYVVGDRLYASEDNVVGPFSSMCYGSIGETPDDTAIRTVISGVTYGTYTTETPYVKESLRVYDDGYLVETVIEYADDVLSGIVSNEGKRRFTIPVPDGILTASYIPIDMSASGATIGSNITDHNYNEQFTATTDRKLYLGRYPFVDSSIVNSGDFDYYDGVFSLRYLYSVTYEPIIIYVNGTKARNISAYRNESSPEFSDKLRETDYQFYVENGTTIVFNEDVSGNIMVYYYVLSDTLSLGISMYCSNSYRNDITPEIHNYTLLCNIQR